MSDIGQTPVAECDVVMKGGITSGVVFPKALLRLKDKFRFRNIGGASAGAIAAGVLAAAELGRGRGQNGFDRIARLPDEMSAHLKDLFQPRPEFAALFGLLLALTKSGVRGLPGALIAGYWPFAVAGVAIGMFLTWAIYAFGGSGWLVAAALTIVLGAAFMVAGLVLDVRTLNNPDYGFGLCPGSTDDPNPKFPPLSDWLAALIEEAAGRHGPFKAPHVPLTFGDLERATPPIKLQMMTTNVSLGRAHVLPVLDGNYFWKEAEFRKLLPLWIVEYLKTVCTPPPDGSDLWQFPEAAVMPVVLAVRMSLSFPVLIAAVPLYRINFPENLPEGALPGPRRVFFSDGGISSNFPIGFFDSLFPQRPTFGISLDKYEDDRKERRAYLPMPANSGMWTPIATIGSLGAFASAIVNTAREWQDQLLMGVSGYRERIVHAYLKDDEGGLNLEMEQDTIKALVDYGDRAGALMTGQPIAGDKHAFDFSDHQWRRFLIAYAQFEQLFAELAPTWGSATTPGSFAAAINATLQNPASYDGPSKAWRLEVFRRVDELMKTAAKEFPVTNQIRAKGVPAHKARLRIVPEP